MAAGAAPTQPRRHGPWDAAAEWLALAGGVLMLAVAGLVTVSVVMRWLADEGISGDFELVQISTALAAFAFLPLCQASRANIIVDSFTARASQRTRDTLDALWDLVYAGASALIAVQLFRGALDLVSSGTTSMVRGLPIGYAVALCAGMAVFLAGTALVTALRLLKGGR